MDQNSHFLNALKMMMHGSWSTSSGASWNGKAFSFPVSKGSLSSTAQKADVKYSGSVHFTGVGGRMDLTLADPEIVVNNGDDHVIMSVKSKTMVGQSVDYGRITFVDMTGSITQGQNDAAQVVGTNVKLNSQAVDAFAGFYQAGKPMDDIDSSLKLGPQSSRPEPTVTPKPSVKPKPTVAPKPSVKPKPRVSPKPSAKPKPTVAPKPDQSTIMAPQSDAATEAAAGEAPSAGAHKIIRKQVCTVVPGASRATSPTSTPAKVGKGSMNWGGRPHSSMLSRARCKASGRCRGEPPLMGLGSTSRSVGVTTIGPRRREISIFLAVFTLRGCMGSLIYR